MVTGDNLLKKIQSSRQKCPIHVKLIGECILKFMNHVGCSPSIPKAMRKTIKYLKHNKIMKIIWKHSTINGLYKR